MRPKDRFEVFKRDGFVCQYCGRKTPEVVLEVDHIIPLALGGGNEVENLLTACWDCNRGKGARLLGETVPVRDISEQAEVIREKEAQLRAYNAEKQAERERKERDYATALDHWFGVWGETSLPRYHIPWESTIRHYIERLGVQEVLEAMDITAGRFDYVTSKPVRYFVGILKRKAAEAEGRVRNCRGCGRTIILTPEQIANQPDPTLDWFHNDCLPVEGADG